MSPFQAFYGYVLPHMDFPTTATTSMAAVESYLKDRANMLDLLKESLSKAQERMKLYADNSRVERSFQVRDLVYLKLQPYRQTSVSLRKNFKLSAKFYSPFKVLHRIGNVAYKLELTSSSRIHPVVHVLQLKQHIGLKHTPSFVLPVVDPTGNVIMLLEKVLQTRTILIGKQLVQQVLIQWAHSSPEEAT
ncbi:uncharacterized protein LOC113279530 [Papaver somniferum]|uniref:uncharacterized protein LOC113279530 n=1 Tax=Papaver somniferum TaxID=3469 RepID=UPI000E6FDE85|nr:uncharacterized protein LOC113279530 [Papaver somniferum]